jgi:LPXTG-motif cell wall-anchored protein
VPSDEASAAPSTLPDDGTLSPTGGSVSGGIVLGAAGALAAGAALILVRRGRRDRRA